MTGASINQVIANAERRLNEAQEALTATREGIASERAELHGLLSEKTTTTQRLDSQVRELAESLERAESHQKNAERDRRSAQAEIEQVVQGLDDFQADL